MSIEELKRLLYDMYQMDVFMPPLTANWEYEFKNMSYSIWAVNEIIEFIAKRIYPNIYASMDIICETTQEFISNVSKYSKMNAETYQVFSSAKNMAITVLDLLEAMK